MAVWALVLSVLGFFTCGLTGLVGLVLTFPASSNIKESGGHVGGRGWITAARVTGILSLVWGALLIILFVVAGASDTSTDDEPDAAPSTVTTSAPTTTAPADDDQGPSARSVDRVVSSGPGTCYDTDGRPGSQWTVVDCNEPHSGEFYAERSLLDEREYPGTEAVQSQADTLCTEAFASYIGVPFEESIYGLYYAYPSESSWEQQDDRSVVCSITSNDPEDPNDPEGLRLKLSPGSKRDSKE